MKEERLVITSDMTRAYALEYRLLFTPFKLSEMIHTLTQRNWLAYRLWSDGATYTQIAKHMNVRRGTAQFHVSTARRALIEVTGSVFFAPSRLHREGWWHRRRLESPYVYRADGWPMCPSCGEDELMSPLSIHQPGKPTDVMHCINCQWFGRIPAR